MSKIKQVTKEQAIALAEGKFYEGMTHREIAEFQISQDLLCMPFGVFSEALSKCLGRGVYTHEFANRDQLIRELYGERPAPSFDEIIGLIPKDKLILINIGAE